MRGNAIAGSLKGDGTVGQPAVEVAVNQGCCGVEMRFPQDGAEGCTRCPHRNPVGPTGLGRPARRGRSCAGNEDVLLHASRERARRWRRPASPYNGSPSHVPIPEAVHSEPDGRLAVRLQRLDGALRQCPSPWRGSGLGKQRNPLGVVDRDEGDEAAEARAGKAHVDSVGLGWTNSHPGGPDGCCHALVKPPRGSNEANTAPRPLVSRGWARAGKVYVHLTSTWEIVFPRPGSPLRTSAYPQLNPTRERPTNDSS